MSEVVISGIGIIAAILSTVASLPQLKKVIKKNSTADLSCLTQVTQCLAALLWSLYGYLINSYILVIECCVVALIHFLILAAIIRDIINTKVPSVSDPLNFSPH